MPIIEINNISLEGIMPLQIRNEKNEFENSSKSSFKDTLNNINKPENQNVKSSINTYRNLNNKMQSKIASRKLGISDSANTYKSQGKKESAAVEDYEDADAEAKKISIILCQLLSVENYQLDDILSLVDMKIEEFDSINKINQLIEKLSTIAELNEEDRNILSDLMDKINNESSINISGISNKEEVTNIEGRHVYSEINEDELFDINRNFNDAKKQLLLKLQGLLIKNRITSKNNSEMFKDDDFIAPESIMTTKLDIPVVEDKVGEKDSKTDQNNEKSFLFGLDKEAMKKDGTKVIQSDLSNVSFEDIPDGEDLLKSNKNDSENSFDRSTLMNFDTSKVNFKENLSADSRTITEIPKEEIFNQILDKAKVSLDGEKSEMIMQLKPDSLGKISLKVVTENGIVMAKFLTENQQVKEIIEANMQFLKDVLLKQGMSIEGFSVFVRQDSANQSGWNNESNKDKKSTGERLKALESNSSLADYSFTDLDKIDAYNWNDSKINLTA